MPRAKVRDQDGIYRRKDSPYWWASLPRVGGGSTRRSTGIPIAEDPEGLKATAVRAQWRAEGHVQKTGEGATFDDLLLKYLREVAAYKRSPRRYHSAAKVLFPHFTGRLLADIGAQEVRAYIAHRQAQGRLPGCINRELGLMSGAMRWAKDELEWDIGNNPWRTRFLQPAAPRTRFLSREEALALLAAADGLKKAPHLGDYLRLMLATGLRPGEALALTWDRVDLGRRMIRFEAGDQKNGLAGTIPLNDSARAALVSRARFRASHCPGSPWVFCNHQGARFLEVRTGFVNACHLAGIADLHPHDLRRTFGSWLVQSGIGIDRVSKLLRHGDVGLTARVYAHLRPQDLADAAAALDGYQLSRSVSRPAPEEEETPAKATAG
ncbi:MAG: site-specific integrase [Chromatiaceae bacterium]|nr:site-specific integrase [Chromatiaceae bacterium]